MFQLPQPSRPSDPELSPNFDQWNLQHNVSGRIPRLAQSSLPVNQEIVKWRVVGFNESGGIEEELCKEFDNIRDFYRFMKDHEMPVQVQVHDTADATTSDWVWVSDMSKV